MGEKSVCSIKRRLGFEKIILLFIEGESGELLKWRVLYLGIIVDI